ncbi:MAG: hypothetical protein H6977_13250 [Gammaproteobacteria bacterium]|nr:hypothetical protein [Gammaproteobacteria bacterium]
MRVLHAPVNVGNQPWVLSRYERELGLASDLVVNYGTWLGLPADRTLGEYGKRDWRAVVRRFACGISAPLRYDVLHYYFGRSLLSWDDWARGWKKPFLDLRLGRALGRKVFMTLQGCDIRLAAESNRRNEHTPCQEGGCNFFANCVANLDAQRLALARDVLPLCDKVFFLNPELGHYVGTAEFMPYASVDIHKFDVLPPAAVGRPRIVHAPSDSALKGTAAILEALESLRPDFDFDLILVQNKPYAEALQLYRSADIAIDQLMAGWYGGFAVEMMAMGKPTLCYLREADFAHVPSQMIDELPLRNIDPNHLRESLADVLARRSEWQRWSGLSRAFVERWHDPRKLAAAMARQYVNAAEPFHRSLEMVS